MGTFCSKCKHGKRSGNGNDGEKYYRFSPRTRLIYPTFGDNSESSIHFQTNSGITKMPTMTYSTYNAFLAGDVE